MSFALSVFVAVVRFVVWLFVFVVVVVVVVVLVFDLVAPEVV